jgi:hypothetical protein
VRTLTKGRVRTVLGAPPRWTEWEAVEWLRRAERAGWRPRETCECEQPKPGFGGGNGFYITSVCINRGCGRRLRTEDE